MSLNVRSKVTFAAVAVIAAAGAFFASQATAGTKSPKTTDVLTPVQVQTLSNDVDQLTTFYANPPYVPGPQVAPIEAEGVLCFTIQQDAGEVDNSTPHMSSRLISNVETLANLAYRCANAAKAGDTVTVSLLVPQIGDLKWQ